MLNRFFQTKTLSDIRRLLSGSKKFNKKANESNNKITDPSDIRNTEASSGSRSISNDRVFDSRLGSFLSFNRATREFHFA